MRLHTAILMGLCAIALTIPSAFAQTASQTTPTIRDQQAKVEAAVRQLIAEAKEIDRLEEPKVKPVFSRPHPALRDFTPDMGELVLRRMTQPLTGNDYRDTYIRWHLIYPVKDMLADRFEQYKETGEHKLPDDASKQLIQLIADMPGQIRNQWQDSEKWMPEDLAREYWRAHGASRVTTGYPPFEKVYHGEAALRVAPEGRKAEITRQVEIMKALRPKIRLVVDEKRKRQNDRLRELNQAVREYRGDLIYALIQTGNENTLDKVVDEVGRQLKKQELAAFDMTAYLYMAVFDGYMQLYDTATLEAASKQLEALARSTDAYFPYKLDGQNVPSWFYPKERNFADYALHLVQLLQSPDVVRMFYENQAPSVPDPRPVPSGKKHTPETLTLDQITGAMQRSIAELLTPRKSNEDLLPNFGLLDEQTMYRLRYIGPGPERQHLMHRFGNHALINWAMLEAGQTYQDPRLFRRINWVLSGDPPYTYDRGVRLQMMGQLSPERWGPWVRRDGIILKNGMTENAGFPYRIKADRDKGWGDHANSLYGVFGLWAAQRSGYDIPMKQWQAMDAHWRKTQQATKGEQPAGWAIGMFNVDDENDTTTNPDYYRATAPMTAGGVAALTLTERFLGGDDREMIVERSPELQKGITFLDKRFKLQDKTPGIDWYYYMWTMRRVGEATGIRTFNNIDWYRDVTAELLNRQSHDGLWRDPSGQQSTLMSTGFALLYLGEATEPIAIAKVKYDGNWNNRPNDLWNFVDYASSTYEVESTWQIFNLDQSVYQLNESPILFISGDEGFKLSDKQIDRLREYIDAGGLLLINPDKAGAAMAKSINTLVSKLYPDRELETIEANHPLYGLHSEVRASVQMRAITNGVRPLVIAFVRDIGQDLQSNDVGRSESFVALSNIYLYTVGMNPRRQRLVSNYLPEPRGGTPPYEVEVARIKHSGDFDPEPGALTQLNRLLQKEHDVKMNLRTVEPAQLGDAKIAFLTTTGDSKLTDAEAKTIRDWLDAGGTLWMDAAGGSQNAAEALATMLEQISPDARPTPLASDDPIIDGRKLRHVGYDNRRVKYRLYALRNTGVTTSPRITAIYQDERPAIIYSPDDLTAGLAGLDHWGIFGYDVDSARHLAVNGVLSVME